MTHRTLRYERRNWPGLIAAVAAIACLMVWFDQRHPEHPSGTPVVVAPTDDPATPTEPNADAPSTAAPPGSAVLTTGTPLRTPGRYRKPPLLLSHRPEGRYSDVLPELIRKAPQDREAALAIYHSLRHCKGVLSTDLPATLRNVPEQEAADHVAHTEEQFELCAGISGELIGKRGQFLEMAAAAGHPQAQLYYAYFPDEILGDERELLRHPDRIRPYKETSLHYLRQVSLLPNAQAYILLASSYATGYRAPADHALAYQYQYSAKMVDPLLGTDEITLAEYAGRISAEARQRAEQSALAELERCCALK
ncbi:hypothetical protein [Tahibacter amnicola]|uniref:Sel1 repeat family protein n=1 Tax=Tahibacter amnicola TaxID=2976241 RepID=A0ABY6BHC3_9GAMM|nr:hypothetical protein [Tahibacter amnicola]UXI68728.1 hypothetical protein N4264_03485 [Tahibacter amnicola]